MSFQKKWKWILPAALLVLIIIVLLSVKDCSKTPEENKADTSVRMSDSANQSENTAGSTVEAQIRNVDFHIAEGIILNIKNIRGRLLPAEKFPHPVFDKKESYILEIYFAEIKMDMQSLSTLLNNFVFAYKGSALKDIKVSITGKQVKQEGKMRGIPFTILSDISVTPEGMIKLHPADIKALGIEVKGLMNFLHLEVQDLVKSNPSSGLKVIDNDLYLDPALMLPPPKIKGHLTKIEPGNDGLTMIFFAKKAPPLKPNYPKANYMYFHGGYLTFGKLTMKDTDMQIMDEDPKDPFDFFNDHYFEQLVAGYHKTTKVDGLLIYMPDYNDMKK